MQYTGKTGVLFLASTFTCAISMSPVLDVLYILYSVLFLVHALCAIFYFPLHPLKFLVIIKLM